MQTELQRHNLVTRALNVTKGTGLALGPYERQLLEQFVQGALSIGEVSTLVAEKSGRSAPAMQDTADCLSVTSLRDAS